MNKILRIWRYVTIGVIVSLLTLSIFVLGCTTDSNPKKKKKSAVMNDPIVTLGIADGESIVTAGILPDSSYYTNQMLGVTHSHGSNYDRFCSPLFYRDRHFKTFISISINHASKLGDIQKNHFLL